MISSVTTLIPVFGLIILGYCFQNRSFPHDEFWPQAGKLTYFVLLPSLLIHRLAVIEFQGRDLNSLVLGLVLSVFIIAALLIGMKPYMGFSNPAFTSVFQGSVRPNTYIGLATASALFGTEGVALVAVAIGVVIPIVNLLSVIVLTYYIQGNHGQSRTKSLDWGQTLRRILQNPLIIACILGIYLSWTDISLPLYIESTLHVLSQAALPIGLLTVGAGLRADSIQSSIQAIAMACFVKLLLLPIVTFILLQLIGSTGIAVTVAVLFSSIPCSASSYILAQQLGGDHRLMAGILTVETAFAILTIPLMLTFIV